MGEERYYHTTSLFNAIYIRTDTERVFVDEIILVFKEAVGGKRHDQDAEAEIRYTETIERKYHQKKDFCCVKLEETGEELIDQRSS